MRPFDRALLTSALMLALTVPMLLLSGCAGEKEPAPPVQSDEPLRLGDDSPLDQLGADAGQN